MESIVGIRSISGRTTAPIFDHPLVGSILVLQRPPRQAKIKRKVTTRTSDYQTVLCYREPVWLSNRAWQFCCLRSQVGWTWTLTTHNVVPDGSPQFTYAKTGKLSALQTMIASGKASIFDRRESGLTLLSVSLFTLSHSAASQTSRRWLPYSVGLTPASGSWNKVLTPITSDLGM